MNEVEKTARYIIDCGDPGEWADMGYELCEFEYVTENFPDIAKALVAAPFNSRERAELGLKLAKEILGS